MNPFDPKYWEDTFYAGMNPEAYSTCDGIYRFLKGNHRLNREEASTWLKKVVHQRCCVDTMFDDFPNWDRLPHIVARTVLKAERQPGFKKCFYSFKSVCYMLVAKSGNGLYRVEIEKFYENKFSENKYFGLSLNLGDSELAEWADKMRDDRISWRTLSDEWEPTWRESE